MSPRRNEISCVNSSRRTGPIRSGSVTLPVFKLVEFYLYTCVILDLFSCNVVAYKVSRKNSPHLITSTFKAAWEQCAPDAGLIFHSDRGVQYTLHWFRQLLHERTVVQSFSNSGKLHDNAVAESFFATLELFFAIAIIGSYTKEVEPMPYTYPLEFKIKAIRRYEKGESIQSLCQELHIAQSTLYHWRKQFCSIMTPQRSYTPKEFDAISHQLQRLEHMMDVIRVVRLYPSRAASKTACYTGASLSSTGQPF